MSEQERLGGGMNSQERREFREFQQSDVGKRIAEIAREPVSDQRTPRYAGATWHQSFMRCPECQHATVGLERPYAINHAAGCSMPLATDEELFVVPAGEWEYIVCGAAGYPDPHTPWPNTLERAREFAAEGAVGGDGRRYQPVIKRRHVTPWETVTPDETRRGMEDS